MMFTTVHSPRQNPAAYQYGYILGGIVSDTSTSITSIDKFTFATEANSVTIAATLSASVPSVGTGWSVSAGYFLGGGNSSSVSATCDKFTFMSDNKTSGIATLSLARSPNPGFSIPSYAYILGGSLTSSTFTNVIDKFTFATETNAVNIGTMTESKVVSGWNTYSHGYAYSSEISHSTRLEKFVFAYDGSSQNVAAITSHLDWYGGMSPTSGYIFGIVDLSTAGASSTATCYKMLLSSETNVSTLGSLVTQTAVGAVAFTLFNAYIYGGMKNWNGTNYIDNSAIQKWGFSQDATSVSVASLGSGAHAQQITVQY